MKGPVAAIALATLAGLTLGFTVPAAQGAKPLALPLLFLQTLVAVGALTEARTGSTRRWAWAMLVRHHVFASVPLMLLGLTAGLETAIGAGAFILGAVPTAIALPSNVAACGGRVRPAVQFTVFAYGIGVIATPGVLLLSLGTSGHMGPMVLSLLVGLVVPATLGLLARPWLQRVPRGLSFAVVSASALVVMLGMGATLREAMLDAAAAPAVIAAAVAIGFGRVVWGSGWALRFSPDDALRLEAALAGGGKNAVLAAVIAAVVIGPLAALPALMSLFAEILLLFAVTVFRGRLVTAPT